MGTVQGKRRCSSKAHVLSSYSSTLTPWCACTDGKGVIQFLRQATVGSSAVLSGLIAACEASVLQPSLAHPLAWSLWQHAVATEHALSSTAQEALWHTQSGLHQTCELHTCSFAFPINAIYQHACKQAFCPKRIETKFAGPDHSAVAHCT